MNNSEPRVRQLLTYVRDAGREYGEVVGKDIDDDDVAFRAYGDVYEHAAREIIGLITDSFSMREAKEALRKIREKS